MKFLFLNYFQRPIFIGFFTYITNYCLINPSQHSIILLIMKMIFTIIFTIMDILGNKCKPIIFRKISSFIWFFELLCFINLEIPVYKYNENLQMISIFRFMSILMIYFQRKNSKFLKIFNLILIFLVIVNLGFIIGIQNSFEIISLFFEISLFFIAIFIFHSKTSIKVLENPVLIKALYFLNEGIIILQEDSISNYKIEFINEKAVHLLDAGSSSSTLNYHILNEKLKDFHFDRIKIQKDVDNMMEFKGKSSITNSQLFSSLTEILFYYKSMSQQDETFHFVRNSNKNSELASNLKLIVKHNFINNKNYFFVFIRSISNLATLKETNELKTRLISSFSHELKTPLNSVIPLLSEVLNSVDSHNKEFILKILSCLKILENSLNNILDYSLILSGQYLINMGVVYIEELMNEIEQIIKEQVDMKCLIFHRENDNSIETDQCIYSDYIRLRQLLLNLILNAIHFTKKGKITLKIKVFAKNPLALEFTVCDTGIGISQTKLNILKEELNSNNEIPINSTGSCLGLIISNNIALLLGKAGIIIESNENQGTSVSFIIVDQANYNEYQNFNPAPICANISIQQNCLKKQIKAYSTTSYKISQRNQHIMDSSYFYHSLRMINHGERTRPDIFKIKSRETQAKTGTDGISLKGTKTISNQDYKSMYEELGRKFTTNSSNHQYSQSFSKKSLFCIQKTLKFGEDSSKYFKFNTNKDFYSKPNAHISCDLVMNEGGPVTFEEIVRNYNFGNLIRLKPEIDAKSLKPHPIKRDSYVDMTLKSSNFGNIERVFTNPFNKNRELSIPQNFHTSEYLSPKTRDLHENCLCDDILIVDDDVFNLFSLEIILKSMNLTCKKATNGQEAIDILKNFKKCNEKCKGMKLVLMDYQMPVLDGVESTKEIIRMINIGEIHEEVNIIGCTAFTAKNEVLKCLEAGMKDIFFKPLNKNVLQEIIRKWLFKEV